MDPVVLLAEEPRGTPSRYKDLIDAKSSRSSRSDSESVDRAAAYSGGAVVLLSLRRLRKHGPTLPSRLAGAADDWRLLLVMLLDARLDRRRMMLPLPGAALAEVVEVPLLGTGLMVLLLLYAASAMGLVVLLNQLWPSELALGFRDKMESGS